MWDLIHGTHESKNSHCIGHIPRGCRSATALLRALCRLIQFLFDKKKYYSNHFLWSTHQERDDFETLTYKQYIFGLPPSAARGQFFGPKIKVTRFDVRHIDRLETTLMRKLDCMRCGTQFAKNDKDFEEDRERERKKDNWYWLSRRWKLSALLVVIRSHWPDPYQKVLK